MSESPIVSNGPAESPTSPRALGLGRSDKTSDETVIDLALAVVSAAVRAKLAAELGAPRLATHAARQTSALADRLVIALSPAVASTPAEVETERLGDVTGTADLLALLRPEPDDLRREDEHDD